MNGAVVYDLGKMKESVDKPILSLRDSVQVDYPVMYAVESVRTSLYWRKNESRVAGSDTALAG